MIAGRDGIENYVAYVGTGSALLPLDQQLPQITSPSSWCARADVAAREQVRDWLTHEVAPRPRSRCA